MIKLELLKIKLQGRLRYNIFVGLAALSVMGISIYDVIFLENDPSWRIFSIILIIAALILLSFNIYFISTSSKDLKDLKKDKYEKVNAKFISFQSKNLSKKGYNKVTYSGQLFRIIGTETMIQLDVDDVELKEDYVIAYGKRSKIGVMIQKYKQK
ncbi:hypothetical protein [Acholeplasma hippikon]|uniref:Uncharacterized protein n=1 Tax=Acholeplasma hippikon TaxID=264636 RepID=A0A449BKR2_9MOLU|nr:hypothetical protein [Acholeplasma hippikon]VEU83061.1 Uncharacterised protein [Acholeplasma hippikon]